MNFKPLPGRVFGEILNPNEVERPSGLVVVRTLKKNAITPKLRIIAIGREFEKDDVTFRFNGNVGQVAILRKNTPLTVLFDSEGKKYGVVWFEDVLACEN